MFSRQINEAAGLRRNTIDIGYNRFQVADHIDLHERGMFITVNHSHIGPYVTTVIGILI